MLAVDHFFPPSNPALPRALDKKSFSEGLPLRVTETPAPRGHAIEFRINAEDPGLGFLPPSGPGIRLDSGVETGSTIPGVFDSLVAKVIVTGATREEALKRARRALAEFRIEGVTTVLPFHRAAIEAEDFVGEDGFKVHTRWIENEFAGRLEAEARPEPVAEPTLIRTHVEIDGRRHELALPTVLFQGLAAAPAGGDAPQAMPAADPAILSAPIAGTLQAWKVADGDKVEKGDLFAVMEAMKMETQVTATRTGTFRTIAETGSYLEAGTTLGRYEE